MTVKTGTAWAGTFVTQDATGALATPSTGPAGVLYVDGVADAATVTITGSNPYKFSVTLPALTAGQRVDMYITATIDGIATGNPVASEQADTFITSDIETLVDGLETMLTDIHDTDLPAVKSDTAAILADTNELQTDLTNGGRLDLLIDAIKADLDNPNQYKADVSGLPTAGEIADSVWDEAISGHTTATTFGGKNQKVVPSETINDYKADVSALTNVTLSAAGVDAILDEVVVGTYTMRQLLKLFGAKLHGTAAGGNTDTITYDSLDGTTTSIIVETVDENGNRTVVLTV